MSDFLIQAACHGCRPLNTVQKRYCSRPDLITRLLRERHVARFIVAPEGFGKSSIAAEYSDTVFHFEHVFWIDAKSPCFLRDLDNEHIATTLLGEDDKAFLVVIEDVPLLDSGRVELFLKEIDCILDRDCEVLVTCVPSCDAFHRHHDRIKLNPADLLLSDTEVDMLRTGAQREAEPAYLMPPSRRIAVLVWGSSSERESFLTTLMHEELPADLCLLVFIILSLQEGSLSDLSAFSSCDTESVALLACRYPYLGIDRQQECFDAILLSIDEIAAVFAPRLDALAQCSSFSNGDVLSARIADVLVKYRKFSRACAVARLLLGRTARAQWLACRESRLIEGVCLVPACQVYESLGSEKTECAVLLDTQEAYRKALLKDGVAACSLARKVINTPDASTVLKVVASLILAHCAEGDECLQASRVAASLACTLVQNACEAKDALLASYRSLAAGASVRAAFGVSCAEAVKTWLVWYEQGVRGKVMMQSGAWILECATALSQEDTRIAKDLPAASIDRIASALRIQVMQCQNDTMNLFDGIAGASFERACEQKVVSVPPLTPSVLLAVHRVELSLFNQRNVYERLERKKDVRKRVLAHTCPDTLHFEQGGFTSPALLEAQPMLTVNLFGGLEVYIGKERVDATLFRRQKVKVLLALLVLNRGREFSRDRLVSLLWPESALDAARKNFYGIWSILRRALTTPTGTCPYLIRQQRGLRIDANLLISDVMRLDEICNILLFERAEYGGWAQVLSQIDERFSDDILPSESENEAIVGRRAECRDKLVDALLSASSRLVGAGDARQGLWFARAALQHDRTREDVYTMLMKAQLGSGQRTAALETYFACRRFLVEDLGIDPSVETMRLYYSIIESEEMIV